MTREGNPRLCLCGCGEQLKPLQRDWTYLIHHRPKPVRKPQPKKPVDFSPVIDNDPILLPVFSLEERLKLSDGLKCRDSIRGRAARELWAYYNIHKVELTPEQMLKFHDLLERYTVVHSYHVRPKKTGRRKKPQKVNVLFPGN